MTLVLFLLIFAGCSDDYPDGDANPASDFEYIVTDDGDVEITKYIGSDTDVVIPKKIENKKVAIIGEKAFHQSEIQTLAMPDSVKYIRASVFSYSANLKEIRISSNLISVGAYAFSNCTSLVSVDLSASTMETLDSGAFKDCAGLKEVKFGKNITEIRDESFYGCAALGEVVLPNSLTSLGDKAFGGCTSLKSITVPPKLDLMSINSPRLYDVPSLETITFAEGREDNIFLADIDFNVIVQ